MNTQDMPTPITDQLEAQIENDGKRDVPQRVYEQMKMLERERAFMLATLDKVAYWANDNGTNFTLKIASNSGLANSIREAVALGGKP